MTSINISNLILSMQEKIDSSTNERDLLYYTKAMSLLKDSVVYTVEETKQIPSDARIGDLYYVQEDGSIYRITQRSPESIAKISSPMFVWGNHTSLIGRNSIPSCDRPVLEVSKSPNWCDVSVASNSVLAIKSDGSLWGFGRNECWILGIPPAGGRTFCSPVREHCSATDWCRVECVNLLGIQPAIFAIKKDGTLWSWGSNNCGFLGFATTIAGGAARCSPVRYDTCYTAFNSCRWTALASGRNHLLALSTTGHISSVGSNNNGQFGSGVTVVNVSPSGTFVREFCNSNNWSSLSAVRYGSLAVKTDGTMWAWGRSFCQALPIGNSGDLTFCSPVREASSSTNWCQVRGRNYGGSAIKTDGTLWSWGFNLSANLGDGTVTSRASPVQEFCSATDWCTLGNRSSSAAIKTDGSLWIWGCQCQGQGSTVGTTFCSPVREFFSATDWCMIDSNRSSSFPGCFVGIRLIENF